MGYSLTKVMFFDDAITLRVHTATHEKHIGRNVTLRDFARGRLMCLDHIEETGEYVATIYERGRGLTGEFIQGRSV